MEKLYKRFQERAFTLTRHLLSCVREALAYLRSVVARVIPACLKERQPSRPTTLECLEAQCDPMLDIENPIAKKGGKCTA